MFDYKKFEDDIVIAMKNALEKWAEEYDDIYILSLDCSRDMSSVGIIANTKEYLSEQSGDEEEDYWYYKYCEGEWELFADELEEISSYMKKYVEDNDEYFVNSETCEYLDAFDEHCDKIIEACKNGLKRFRESINADFSDLMLSFCIAEYLDNEERIEIFKLLNSDEALKEYAEHIEDFN